MALPRPRPATRTALHDLLEAVRGLQGARIEGDPGTVVTGVTLDSRTVQDGDLYAALPGAHVHGAAHGASAARGGAVAVLTDAAGRSLLTEAGVDLPTLVVAQPRTVLGEVARTIYASTAHPLRLVGITGTNGKTTTAHLVTSALTALGEETGLIGTVETRIGEERIRSVRTTPEATDLHALLAVMGQRGLHTCVMEVSSHALVLHRVDGVVYDVALFTNLSQDHLDFHATMRDYFEAKASLFTPLRSRSGIVCVDDEWGRELADRMGAGRTGAGRTGLPVVTLASDVAVEADWQVEPDPGDVMAFTLTGPDAVLHLRSALPGVFNVVNTAMAALTLRALGIADPDVERAILADPHVPGRMEVVTPSGGATTAAPTAVVDYAHTPEAVGAALTALRPNTPGALVVVLGAGGDRDRGKRAAMGQAAAAHADVVIVTDDNPRSEDPAAIRSAVLSGATLSRATLSGATQSGAELTGEARSIREVAGRAEAIHAAVEAAVAAGPGSTVAVVGKGHETGQEVDGVVHPFDDRVELRQALDAVLAAHHRGASAS